MIKTLAIAAAAVLALSSCSDEPSKDEQRLEFIHEKAPSFAEVYTDGEAVDFMNDLCEGQDLDYRTPTGVTEEDYLYVQGLALGSC